MKRLTSLIALSLASSLALADDGLQVLKSISHDGQDLVAGQLPESEHAFVDMMKFYVPSQKSDGSPSADDPDPCQGIEYCDIDEALVETRDMAKPLIAVYIKGPIEGVDGTGFTGFGRRDAYAAVSLDDGLTWKKTNLSNSADDYSSDVVRADVDLFGDLNGNYPGDVVNVFQATAGRNAIVVWPSRYCKSGRPNYSLQCELGEEGENFERCTAIAGQLNIDLNSPSPDDLYLLDMFGVAGSQGSVDYAEDKWEQNHPVGEVPYNCLWAARGVLRDGDDPRTEGVEEASHMRWFQAERLTSGRRDVNRVEVAMVADAGLAITWQEDPRGLMPGQGEGPGEGWSGAIANSQTDVWYSYLDWKNFALVEHPEDPSLIITLDDYYAGTDEAIDVTTKPKVGVPLAMPMRVTDNAKCNTVNPQPYCYGTQLQAAAVDRPELLEVLDTLPGDYGLKDMCYDFVRVPKGHDKQIEDLCVAEVRAGSGMYLPLLGNTAATRPRLNLHVYDANGDGVIDQRWVILIAEESKGLGSLTVQGEDGFATYSNDGYTYCERIDGHGNDQSDEEATPCYTFDEGKNIWYYSFGMSLTNMSGAVDQRVDGLLANLAGHGNMLNQPEVDWRTGSFFPPIAIDEFADVTGAEFGDYTYEIYNTEIARRGSLLTQPASKIFYVKKDKNKTLIKPTDALSGLVALPAWKQGIMNQGGPADVMVRRIRLKDAKRFDPLVNPYRFANMDCEAWAFAPGVNPFYPDGLCADPAINMSATIPDVCVLSDDGSEAPCPVLSPNEDTGNFVSDTNPILVGKDVKDEEDDGSNKTKVLQWHQCPSEATVVSSSDGLTLPVCEDASKVKPEDLTTLYSDQSWYNPYDVAKGHRGYLDGDFVMMLYAWSPNWKLNAKGKDRYDLYIRRSFDGAASFTTLPSNYVHWDYKDNTIKYDGKGTTTCETYRDSAQQVSGESDEPRVCNRYDAGAFEQARNVTQHKAMSITTLDPRYAVTAASIVEPMFEEEDTRDPSRYFIVFETGDNRTTQFGEAEALNLFYSRGVMFGDHYQVWAEEDDLSVCFPSDPHGWDVPEELIDSGFCNEFDLMSQGKNGLSASEASLEANPGGEFMYGAWSQTVHDTETGELEEADAKARRIWYIDDYISDDPEKVWDLRGFSQPE